MGIPVLKFKLHYQGMESPNKAHDSDSGVDLSLVKIVEKRENVFFFDTGVSIEPPSGYFCELFPRSSIYKHDFTMVNSVGVIDAGYRGIIYMPMRYLGNGDGLKAAEELLGKRVGQLVLKKLEPFTIQIVSELSESERGEKGFGSSG